MSSQRSTYRKLIRNGFKLRILSLLVSNLWNSWRRKKRWIWNFFFEEKNKFSKFLKGHSEINETIYARWFSRGAKTWQIERILQIRIHPSGFTRHFLTQRVVKVWVDSAHSWAAIYTWYSSMSLKNNKDKQTWEKAWKSSLKQTECNITSWSSWWLTMREIVLEQKWVQKDVW